MAGREEGRSKTREGERERGKHVWLEGKGAAQAAKPEEALSTLPCSQASQPKGPGQQERPQGAAAAPGAPAAALGTQQLRSPCSLATGCWSKLPLHARARTALEARKPGRMSGADRGIRAERTWLRTEGGCRPSGRVGAGGGREPGRGERSLQPRATQEPAGGSSPPAAAALSSGTRSRLSRRCSLRERRAADLSPLIPHPEPGFQGRRGNVPGMLARDRVREGGRTLQKAPSREGCRGGGTPGCALPPAPS